MSKRDSNQPLNITINGSEVDEDKKHDGYEKYIIQTNQRHQKENETFCGTHLKGTPHGIVNEGKKTENKFKKVQIMSEEIDGIIYHLDNEGNIYDPQDIHQNLENPKIIAKCKKDTDGKYHILK